MFCIFLLFCSPVSDLTKTVRYASACSNPSNHTMSLPNNRFSTHAQSGKVDTSSSRRRTTREKSHRRFHGDLSPDQPVKLLNSMTNKPISIFFFFFCSPQFYYVNQLFGYFVTDKSRRGAAT